MKSTVRLGDADEVSVSCTVAVPEAESVAAMVKETVELLVCVCKPVHERELLSVTVGEAVGVSVEEWVSDRVLVSDSEGRDSVTDEEFDSDLDSVAVASTVDDGDGIWVKVGVSVLVRCSVGVLVSETLRLRVTEAVSVLP